MSETTYFASSSALRMAAYRRTITMSKFGDAPANPDDLNSYMDQSVSNLKDAYLKGGAQIDLNPDNLLTYVTGGAYDNSALDSVESAYAKIGGYIDQLDTDLRQAVLAGTNQSGNPYDITKWQSFAKDVASDISSQTQYAWDSSVIAEAPSSAILAAKATADQVSNPFAWPWYVWAAVAVGGLYLIRPLIPLVFGSRKKSEATTTA